MRLTPKRRAADLRLRREFGITLADYETMLDYQLKKCAICERPVSTFKTRLAVDHDHITGLIRGLLCYWCNKALGVFRDDVMRLWSAYAYLNVPPAVNALGRRHITAPGRVGTKKRAKLLKAMRENERH